MVEIESIKRLDVQPGETLVVKASRAYLTRQEADALRAQVAACLPDGVRLLVHADDIELTVVSNAEATG